MSNLFRDSAESGDWEPYFQAWLEVEPPENNIPEDLTDEEIEAWEAEAKQKEEEDYYNSFYGHPSLPPQERNPSLK